MFGRILKFIIGILFIPVPVAVSFCFYEQISDIQGFSSTDQKYFLAGAAAYLIIQIIFFKPEYLYVLGHETVHSVATLLSGGKVTSFKASSKGGRITATKSNPVIALAPYIFPFYTLIIAAAFFSVRQFFDMNISYNTFLFLVGFTMSFHILFTVDMLKMEQTDFMHAGYLLSVCIIYVLNIIVVSLVLSLLFREASFPDFIRLSYYKAKDIYISIYSQLFL